jgi:hypothetical protein
LGFAKQTGRSSRGNARAFVHDRIKHHGNRTARQKEKSPVKT